MLSHASYIQRALQLAKKGSGFTAPNPMVGTVVVHNNTIIGEGYHRECGKAHAEVNAIQSVENQSLLQHSTLYVSLEPCSHHGKTPPCVDLIIAKKIPRVVVATLDPNPKVSGKGIQKMRDNGIEVMVGVLEKEAQELNKSFFVAQTLRRPYIILKWAKSSDGFIDIKRQSLQDAPPVRLSNDITTVLSHKLRTEVQAILVGTRTAKLDDPQLTARKWFGKTPIRVVIDRDNTLPPDLHLFDQTTPTFVFSATESPASEKKNITNIQIDFTHPIEKQILHHLFERNIHSLLVEGGATTLSSFINNGWWDEATIEISDTILSNGVKSPDIQGEITKIEKFTNSTRIRLETKTTRNFT